MTFWKKIKVVPILTTVLICVLISINSANKMVCWFVHLVGNSRRGKRFHRVSRRFCTGFTGVYTSFVEVLQGFTKFHTGFVKIGFIYAKKYKYGLLILLNYKVNGFLAYLLLIKHLTLLLVSCECDHETWVILVWSAFGGPSDQLPFDLFPNEQN